MMATFDAAELMPDADQETMNDHFREACFYTAAPMSHVSEMLTAKQPSDNTSVTVCRYHNCTSMDYIPEY